MAEQKDWSKWATAGELLEKQAKQRVGLETAYTAALEALEKITAVSSGSYNAAVDLRDGVVSLAIRLDDLRASVDELKSSAAAQEQVDGLEAVVQRLAEDYGRLEARAQDHVTWQQKIAEEYERFADFMEKRLDMVAAVEAAKSHESRITSLENWRTQSQSMWRNRIAWMALEVAIILGVLKLIIELGWLS